MMLPLLVSPQQGIILVTLTSLAGTSVFAHHICRLQCRVLQVQPLLVGVKLLVLLAGHIVSCYDEPNEV